MMNPAGSIVQVVPAGEGGVFDYANCLQAQWANTGNISMLLPVDRAGVRRRPLFEQIEGALSTLAERSAWHAVVLHYSGYGYHPRGLCGWLLREVQALRAQQPRFRLVVVYHELFASGPPWRSAFWLSRVQASLAARLARQADALWTNTEHHARWLQHAAAVEVHCTPVFSNVGEPEPAVPPRTRAPRAVVFGAPSTRRRALQGLQPFHATLRRLGVEELVEVGSGAAAASDPAFERLGATLPCRHAGLLNVPALRELLLSSRFGVIDYCADLLGKSGVFAAYAAHGCVVLDTNPLGRDSDGLRRGVDYVDLQALSAATVNDASCHDAMANNLARWYAGHTLDKQAQALWSLAAG